MSSMSETLRLVRASSHPLEPIPSWAKSIFKVGREVFGIVHCAYELLKQYGAGCGNP